MISRVLNFIILGLALWPPANASAGENCGNNIACAVRSVVSVLPQWPANTKRSEEPEGSGIFISEGKLIATADHILGPANSVLIRNYAGKIYEAKILLRDRLSDVALLEIDEKHKAFEYSFSPQLAQKACAIGNSFGLDISLSCGVVSAVNKSGVGFNKIEDFVQSDASVNPGMSGGALVGEDGRLIGMLSAIFTKGSDADIGVNFSVSAKLLNIIVADYMEDGRLDRVDSGVALIPGAKRDNRQIVGVKIRSIKPGSFEAISGLKPNDLVTMIAGNSIKHPARYSAILAMIRPGKEIEIRLLRNSIPMRLTARFN